MIGGQADDRAGVVRAVAARAVGVLAVCAVLAGCARPVPGSAPPSARASAPPSVPASAPPSAAAEVGESMLLVPGDFAEPGWRTQPATPSSRSALDMPDCPIYQAADYPAQRHRDAVRTRAFAREGHEAREWVEHFAPGWAARSFDDARRFVETCQRYERGEHSPGAPGYLESHWIEAEEFAGDESILIGTSRVTPMGTSFQSYTAMVRVGDRVATCTLTALDADLDARAVQDLARRATARLT